MISGGSRMRRSHDVFVVLCVWRIFLIVWTDEWFVPSLRRQSERACGGSEGSGGAWSSCEPGQGGFVGGVVRGW
jgi:hypothetical protein